MSETHIVTGSGGQDGLLLTRLLARDGHRVIACIRPGSEFPDELVATSGVEVVEHDLRDIDGFASLVGRLRPSAVHNLAALSSVAQSWTDPATTAAINHQAVVETLDVLRLSSPQTHFIQASSSDIVGHGAGPGSSVDETTPIAPLSPYAEAKAAAHRAVQSARADGMHATNLILFGHTSPLHDPVFVLPRITSQAAELKVSGGDTLWLFDPEVSRDWGSAGDFMRAFVLAAQAPAGDFVIGTGELHALREIAGWAMEHAGVDAQVARPADAPTRANDVQGLRANTSRASADLGWVPHVNLRTEIEHMVDDAIRRLNH